jgi:hypothetical protein
MAAADDNDGGIWSNGFEVVIRDPEARLVVLNETVGCGVDDVAAAGGTLDWQLDFSLTDGCYAIQMTACRNSAVLASSSSATGDLAEWMTSELSFIPCEASPCSLAFCVDAGIIFRAPSRAPSFMPSALSAPLPTAAPSVSLSPTRSRQPTSTGCGLPDDVSAGLCV